MSHNFGGIWTSKKIEVLQSYLEFYTVALKNMRFRLHYIDAFAGTGSHSPKIGNDQESLIPFESYKGSVTAALEIEPGFDFYHFNDIDPEHVKELQKIKQAHGHKRIELYEKDANSFIPEICSRLGKKDRAVLFIDPYSTQLNWNTLEAVANSKKVDLWLLFPISVILRMTPKDGAKVVDEWRNTLTRLLGTQDWEDELYKPNSAPATQDLFEDSSDIKQERVNVPELETWIEKRLSLIFSHVDPPLKLENRGRPLFLFFFAVSNDSPAAINLGIL